MTDALDLLEKRLNARQENFYTFLKLDLQCVFSGFLPREIGDFVNVKKMTLSGCNLIFLPEEMANLKNLEILDLSCNMLQEFPQIIAEGMQNLVSIDIQQNKFKTFPTSLAFIPTLKTIEIFTKDFFTSYGFFETIPEHMIYKITYKHERITFLQNILQKNKIIQEYENIIENLKEQNKKLNEEIIELKFRPPLEGGDGFYEAFEHFKKLKN